MMGTSIGISASQMNKDFGAAMSTLAVYGSRSIEVFTGIAAAAKAAGVETSELLGMAKKFDTFAEGAETAGKLNAILGSNISSTQLLRMSEEQRIETLIMTVQASGQAFSDMDKYTQIPQAYTNIQPKSIPNTKHPNLIQHTSSINIKSYKNQDCHHKNI